MLKQKAIVLRINYDDGLRYQIVETTNTMDFTPMDMLTKQQVEDLIANDGWNITIRPMYE